MKYLIDTHILIWLAGLLLSISQKSGFMYNISYALDI